MYQYYYVVLLLTGAILLQAKKQLKQKTTEPPATCELVDCADGRVCRYATTCKTCAIEIRCVPIGKLPPSIDNECRANNLSEAILLENKVSKSYSQLKSNQVGFRCPAPSVRIETGKRRSICCRNQAPAVKSEKPDVCPKENLICGGVVCQSDNDCSGVQKCCPACGNLICSDPEGASGCANVKCSIGQECLMSPDQIPTCVTKSCG